MLQQKERVIELESASLKELCCIEVVVLTTCVVCDQRINSIRVTFADEQTSQGFQPFFGVCPEYMVHLTARLIIETRICVGLCGLVVIIVRFIAGQF